MTLLSVLILAALPPAMLLQEQVGGICEIAALTINSPTAQMAQQMQKDQSTPRGCRLVRVTVGSEKRGVTMMTRGFQLGPDVPDVALWAWRSEAVPGILVQLWSYGGVEATTTLENGESRSQGWEDLDSALTANKAYRLVHFAIGSNQFLELFVRVKASGITVSEASRVCSVLGKRLALPNRTIVFFGKEPLFFYAEMFPTNHPGLVSRSITYEESRSSYLRSCVLNDGRWRCR